MTKKYHEEEDDDDDEDRMTMTDGENVCLWVYARVIVFDSFVCF